MAKNLVIVESPAKAKTISKFLGKDYEVLASMGHVRDLPKSDMGIDVAGSFTPSYEVTTDKKKVITSLKSALKGAEHLWVATDEDREGEAIGWHLLEALKVPKKTAISRIVFHEITKTAIQDAIKNPRQIDQNLVDAQQARRVLDRLVGYELSPLLWKKVKYGLSAGRVQSVAVRLIVEREREIEAFVPVEYWKLIGDFEKKKAEKGEPKAFSAQLQKFKGKKFEVNSEKGAKKVLNDVKGAAFTVTAVEKKEVKRNPAPPFTTSTLQQEAARKLGFSVKKTMMVAQQLYEGSIPGVESGLITYMRTDSVNLSNLALTEAKKLIVEEFGKQYALSSPRRYKGRKGAQEAHEAIRPVDVWKRPEALSKILNKDQYRLYELIWKRTLACQMAQAILDQTGVDVEPFKAGKSVGYTFRATGQVVKFPGFMGVYMEGRDHGEEEDVSDGDSLLPNLVEGEEVDLNKMNSTQHFTKPPARYTEASLVKKLESEGIGRPSTYAPTIGTIMARGYVEKEGRSLKPTDTAMLVTDVLVEHFSDIVDYKFTAEMEEKLDSVEDGEVKWVPMVKEFYGPFHKNIESKEKTLKKEDLLKERVIGKDPKTGLDVVARIGRFGPYVQIGNFTKEELDAMEEPPKRASLPKGAYMETITMEEAMKALSLPRELGKNADGELVTVMTGRFGPYMKVGKKNVSLPPDYDPYTVELDQVEQVIKDEIARKKKMMEPIAVLGNDPVSGGEIQVREGRFGPYVTDGKTNASISKKLDPKEVTLEVAAELLEKKRHAKPRGRGRK